MTKQPKTVDAIDRETERLRAEKRGVLAALHACSGRDGDSPGTLLESLDALDRALERLGARRLRAVAELHDPEASARRRERRAVALGRWLETRSLTLDQMRRVETLAGEAGCGLFADEALAADGWRRDAHGHWHGPLSPGAAAGPVGDVVVLAQARADVERNLQPSFEQVLSGGDLVALDEPDDEPVEPPEDIGDAERAAWNDANTAAEFSREYAALMKAYAAGAPKRRDTHRRRRAGHRPVRGARPGEGARARRRAGGGGPCGDGALEAREGVVAPQPLPGLGEVRGPWRKHRLRMRFARSGPRAAPPRHRTQAPTGEVRR